MTLNVHKAHDDWNHLYEQEWVVASRTYSQKWGWEYSQQPYAPHPQPVYVKIESYKKSGPNVSTIYRKMYGPTYSNDYVNDLGDL